MAKELDGEEVHGSVQARVMELCVVEKGRGYEGIDEDEGWLAGDIGVRY